VVRLNGNDFGPTPSRAASVAAAIKAAVTAYGEGLQAEVLIHLGGRFHTIWVNGRNLLQSAA
jgi:hypothetical protein